MVVLAGIALSAALVTQLAVADWPPAGTYCDNQSGVFDGSGASVRYYLVGAVIKVQRCIDGKPIVLRGQAGQYLIDHYGEGKLLTRPVRYTVVAAELPENFAFGQPAKYEDFPDSTADGQHAESVAR